MNKNISDENIKVLLKDNLPPAPRSPWFTKKVMNRLPEKRHPAYSRIEYAAYSLAAILLVGAWIMLLSGIRQTGTVTLGNIATGTVLTVIGVVVIGSFMAPYVRRWLQNA